MKLYLGECSEILKNFPDNSVDSIVTDPPYGLSQEPNPMEVLSSWLKGEDYSHNKKGFMQKGWDAFVPNPSIWKECLRVLKPGGHLVAFAGSRTYDYTCLSIRLAEFEIRDQIMWVYSSGFPKSHNISKAIDKSSGTFNAEEISNRWDGWGTALKPAHEPIVLARKPIEEKTVVSNVMKYGTGAININDNRIPLQSGVDDSQIRVINRNFIENGEAQNWGMNTSKSDNPQVVSSDGRFPANLIHDGSEEVLEHFPYTKSGLMKQHITGGEYNVYGKMYPRDVETHGDEGSAARFFYCAKTSPKERNLGGVENKHPTVKPISLMQHLIKLITPKGGIVLDPFMGSGTTGIAAILSGFEFIGVEMDESYFEIAQLRTKFSLDNREKVAKLLKVSLNPLAGERTEII
jgi:site-specific DNA-methyltransferase (adenine-specific)